MLICPVLGKLFGDTKIVLISQGITFCAFVNAFICCREEAAQALRPQVRELLRA